MCVYDRLNKKIMSLVGLRFDILSSPIASDDTRISEPGNLLGDTFAPTKTCKKP